MRACVLEDSSNWDRDLPSIEFTYNNNFHSSKGMTLYETLCRIKCRTPLSWLESGENSILNPGMVQQTIEKIKMIMKKLRTIQSRKRKVC